MRFPLCVVLLVIQELWDREEELSDASGHAYTDRHGVRRNTQAEIIGLAKTVLSQWGGVQCPAASRGTTHCASVGASRGTTHRGARRNQFVAWWPVDTGHRHCGHAAIATIFHEKQRPCTFNVYNV